MFLVDKISKLWQKPRPIHNKDDLKAFLIGEIAKVSGDLVIKYSVKRLGKLHYNLAKDQAYVQELVGCQVKLHAELLADFGHLLAQLMKFENVKACEGLKDLLKTVHEDYVETAPQGTQVRPCLTEPHFAKSDIKVRELSILTGEFLYNTLPMTDNLYESNVAIFQGQVRTAYIGLLENIGKRVDYGLLRESLNQS